MIEKSTDGEGDVGRASSTSIGSGWNGKSEVARKGEPRTVGNSREKRGGDSSGPGVVCGIGRQRLGGGVADLGGGA